MTITKEQISAQFGIELNDDQLQAVNMAVDWYRGWQDRRHRRPIFFLAGFAGTGKTTVARIIAELCCTMDWTVFIAPTGKAAARLREKGCTGAQTLHQFVYRVAGEDEDGEPIFTAKGDLDHKPRLVVLDEASMVGRYDKDKLIAHKIPVLALGDHGQVPPVKDAQFFVKDSEDYLLTQIERNAGNIVRASMFVREGKRLPIREYDDVRVRDANIPDQELLDHAGDDGVLLCAFNTTRTALNKKIRKLLGFSGPLPQIGEKLVCTYNQHGYNIMNGEQVIVTGYSPLPEGAEDADEPEGMMLIEFRCLSDGKSRVAKFNPLCFSVESEDERKSHMKNPGGWDFGWVLTFHKSQGSEWPLVLMIEENLRGVPYAQLMYTGITRAIKRLTFYRR